MGTTEAVRGPGSPARGTQVPNGTDVPCDSSRPSCDISQTYQKIYEKQRNLRPLVIATSGNQTSQTNDNNPCIDGPDLPGGDRICLNQDSHRRRQLSRCESQKVHHSNQHCSNQNSYQVGYSNFKYRNINMSRTNIHYLLASLNL